MSVVDGRFSKLWSEASALWDAHENDRGWEGYVSADYGAIYEQLLRLEGQVSTFIEWGSGLGVVTIMASMMGYDAYGIESQSVLLDLAEDLALKYGSDAKFAEGNFIPDEFVWNPANGDEFFRTDAAELGGYDQLDMELRDFDLIYVFPWPAEFPMMHNIVRDCGGENALLMTYSAKEGLELTRFNEV